MYRSTNLGIDARRALTNAQLRSIAAWRIRGVEASTPEGIARQEARRLAKTVLEQTKSLADNYRQLASISDGVDASTVQNPTLRSVRVFVLNVILLRKVAISMELVQTLV